MNPPPSDAATVAEQLRAVNPAAHLVCVFCQSDAPEHLIPFQGKHIHACPGFIVSDEHQPGDFDAYFDGRFIAGRRTRAAAQQELDSYVFGLIEHGLATMPAAVLGEDSLAQTLADFDYPAGVSHRSVSAAELEHAAELLRQQHPSNVRKHQLAAEVLVAHAEQRLQFIWRSGMLEVVSWSSDGGVHHVNPISGCEECADAQRCIHAVLHQMLTIRERGMTALIRRERHGGYQYEVAA